MYYDKQTLLHYLSKENPKLYLMEGSSKTNTTTKNDSGWGWPAEIREWSFFEFENLKKEHEHLLQREFSFPYLHPPSTVPFLEIHDEGSFEVVPIKWNHSRVSEALAQTQEVKNNALAGNVYMVKGGQAELVPPLETKKKKKGKASRPDWGGIKRIYDGFDKSQKYWNILPGETKLSQKWHNKGITVGRVWPEFKRKYHYPQTTRSAQYEQLWRPLRQIFSYCTRLERRYGYIITDQELVVVKVDANSRYNESDPKTAGRLEFKSIPWENEYHLTKDGSPKMTVNLALWWLYTLANEDEGFEWPHEPFEEPPPVIPSTNPPNIEDESTLVSDTPFQSFVSDVSHLRRGLDDTELTETEEDSDEDQNDVDRITPSKRKSTRPPEKLSARQGKMRKRSSRP